MNMARMINEIHSISQKNKKEVFHQLTGSAYDIVVAERNYYEVSAGIFVAGATELRYAEMWNRYPTPEYLEHNAQIIFGEQVRDTVRHLTEEGQDKLERLISHYERSRGVWGLYRDGLQELHGAFRKVSASDSRRRSDILAVFAEYRDFLIPFLPINQDGLLSMKSRWWRLTVLAMGRRL